MGCILVYILLCFVDILFHCFPVYGILDAAEIKIPGRSGPAFRPSRLKGIPGRSRAEGGGRVICAGGGRCSRCRCRCLYGLAVTLAGRRIIIGPGVVVLSVISARRRIIVCPGVAVLSVVFAGRRIIVCPWVIILPVIFAGRKVIVCPDAVLFTGRCCVVVLVFTGGGNFLMRRKIRLSKGGRTKGKRIFAGFLLQSVCFCRRPGYLGGSRSRG